MKHLVVKPKTTFERFKPRVGRIKGVTVYPSHKTHICTGQKRGVKHIPTVMHRSGFAQSGHNLLQRFECRTCGYKGTFSRSG